MITWYECVCLCVWSCEQNTSVSCHNGKSRSFTLFLDIFNFNRSSYQGFKGRVSALEEVCVMYQSYWLVISVLTTLPQRALWLFIRATRGQSKKSSTEIITWSLWAPHLSNLAPHSWIIKQNRIFCSVSDFLRLRGLYSPPGSSVHGILQARILEWMAISFSRGIFPTQGSNLHLLHLLH